MDYIEFLRQGEHYIYPHPLILMTFWTLWTPTNSFLISSILLYKNEYVSSTVHTMHMADR